MVVVPLFRGVAVLGMLWVASAVWFLLSVATGPVDKVSVGLALLVFLLTMFVRLYCLRRWAAIATCAFFLVNTLPAVLKGEGLWPYSAILVTVGFGLLTFKGWNTLSPGF